MNTIRKLNHCVYIIGTAQNLQNHNSTSPEHSQSYPWRSQSIPNSASVYREIWTTLFFLDYYGYYITVYYIIWKIRKYCSINSKFKAHVVTLWDLPPSRPPWVYVSKTLTWTVGSGRARIWWVWWGNTDTHQTKIEQISPEQANPQERPRISASF